MDPGRRTITLSSRRGLLLTLIGVATLSLHTPVHAHGELPYMKQLFLQNGEFVGGVANYGLVNLTQDALLWTTEETLGSEPRLYHRLEDGRLLAAGFKGLFITHDHGCQWRSQPAFSGHVISSLRAVPRAPSTLVLTTASRDQPNGVFISRDHGESWEQLGPSFAEMALQSVLVMPGEEKLWVQGNTLEGWTPMLLEFSPADNEWTPLPLDLSLYHEVRLIDYSIETTHLLLGAETLSGKASLLSSRDGLQTLERVGTMGDGMIIDVANLGDLRFVTTLGPENQRSLWRSNTGARFEPVDGPKGCLEAGDDGTLWACGDIVNGGHVLWTKDGDDWQAMVPFQQTCPRSCAVDTLGADLNPIAAKKMLVFGVGLLCDEPPVPAPKKQTTGGCQAGPTVLTSTWNLLLVLAFGLLLRRRRPARRP